MRFSSLCYAPRRSSGPWRSFNSAIGAPELRACASLHLPLTVRGCVGALPALSSHPTSPRTVSRGAALVNSNTEGRKPAARRRPMRRFRRSRPEASRQVTQCNCCRGSLFWDDASRTGCAGALYNRVPSRPWPQWSDRRRFSSLMQGPSSLLRFRMETVPVGESDLQFLEFSGFRSEQWCAGKGRPNSHPCILVGSSFREADLVEGDAFKGRGCRHRAEVLTPRPPSSRSMAARLMLRREGCRQSYLEPWARFHVV